jgi:thiosulfate/3-mercaptopyruvate sulfurtransferase
VTAMDPVVSTDWLAAHLGEPGLRVIDATWYMPHLGRDARVEFAERHVPGAVFFDIDAIADHTTSLPHMLPGAPAFAAAVGALGIGDGDRVVAYGAKGFIASARAWWMFRVFGHDDVAVLDGGLPRWRAEGRPLEAGAPSPSPRAFTAKLRPELVADLAAVRANLERPRAQIVDARSAGRFAGTEPEPRPGLRGGHIPGSLSLPYDAVVAADGTLLPAEEIRRRFAVAGVDPGGPVTATCGSGVSAAVLALGLFRAGNRDAAVYDGSWTEWGGRDDTPIER